MKKFKEEEQLTDYSYCHKYRFGFEDGLFKGSLVDPTFSEKKINYAKWKLGVLDFSKLGFTREELIEFLEPFGGKLKPKGIWDKIMRFFKSL